MTFVMDATSFRARVGAHPGATALRGDATGPAALREELSRPGALLQFASFCDVFRRDLALLPAEMRDHVVRQRRHFRVAVGMTERWHINIGFTDAHLHAFQDRLGHVLAFRIVDAARAGEAGVRRLLSRAVPLVAAGAGTFEEAL